jgi:molybdate transport system substrate-binding protein
MTKQAAGATIKVITSGGFVAVYRAVLPEFEQSSGINVDTGFGASEGGGPKTIRNQLANGAKADVVILSREGIHKLIEDGRVVAESETRLATVALGVFVRTGSPKPDISTDAAFRKALIDAGRVASPSSTCGLYLRDTVFPKLALPDTVELTLVYGGTGAAEALRSGKANISIGPVSELIQETGVDTVGPLPPGLQLVQTFAAAIVSDSQAPEAAKRLIDFLSSDSDSLRAAIKRAGMDFPSL